MTVIGDSEIKRGFDPQADDLLTVTHWTGLDRGLGRPGQGLPPPTSPDLPDAMLASAESLKLRYEAIVLDEGQEFTPQQLEGLTWLLDDPEQGPFYVFADPFQHSGMFTAAQQLDMRERLRGAYRWEVPFDAAVIPLVDNVRNAQPICELGAAFVLAAESRSHVQGGKPEFLLTRRSRDLVSTAGSRISELLGGEALRPNQLLVVLLGVSADDFTKHMWKVRSVQTVSVRDLTRFPLTPNDLRVAWGDPDLVQGLEAEVVIVLVRTDSEITVARVRDLYVAVTRARSHLIVVSDRTEEQLKLAARVAFSHEAQTDAGPV
jgi:hypothetical protein